MLSSRSKMCNDMDPLHTCSMMLGLSRALVVLRKHNKLLSHGRPWKIFREERSTDFGGFVVSSPATRLCEGSSYRVDKELARSCCILFVISNSDVLNFG